jgi:hypothetical protein
METVTHEEYGRRDMGRQRKRRGESCMKQEHSNAYSLYGRRRRRRRGGRRRSCEDVRRHRIGSSGGAGEVKVEEAEEEVYPSNHSERTKFQTCSIHFGYG